MKMISAVKLRKSQERLVSLRPYADKMRAVTVSVVGRIMGHHLADELVLGPSAQAFLNPRDESASEWCSSPPTRVFAAASTPTS